MALDQLLAGLLTHGVPQRSKDATYIGIRAAWDDLLERYPLMQETQKIAASAWRLGGEPRQRRILLKPAENAR